MFVARMYVSQIPTTVRHSVGGANTFITGHTNERPLSAVSNPGSCSSLHLSLFFLFQSAQYAI